ncbi:MAG: hypothetical protein DRJ59_06110 [Thermoprotei archaeon]|nr:MAG: hypothetical protein DRJ59_06110 [Thermoprotei archaeon]
MDEATSRCRYREEYFDYELGKIVIYECPRQAVTERGFCEFHDSDYWREHEEEVRSKFEEMIKRAQEKPEKLLCIGFNLPSVEVRGVFRKPVYFSFTEFHEEADFSGTEFHQGADFSDAEFHQKAYFFFTEFRQGAYFSGTEFHEEAYFRGAEFHQGADFSDAEFHQKAYFFFTEFHQKAYFSGTEFNGRTMFIYTRLIFSTYDYIKDEGIYGGFKYISFRDARFLKPSEVFFDHVYLGRVSFINCNIERVNFKNVIWRKEKGGRYVVFDEELLAIKANPKLIEELEQRGVKIDAKVTLWWIDVTLDDVLSVYRRLRENYDYNLRYIESGKFFVSEMEVRRLYREVGTKVIYNDWFRRNLSITNVYKLLCLYGESHIRPIVLMLAVILTSTVLRLLLHSNLGMLLDINTILGAVEDSVRAFFQMGGVTGIDLAERLLSIPILGTLMLSLRRRFERRFRH